MDSFGGTPFGTLLTMGPGSKITSLTDFLSIDAVVL